MVQKYTSLYKKDPTTAEQEAGIQGTDVYQGSPYALSSVPEFEGIKSSTTDYNRYSDLYNLYLGGGLDDYVEGIDPSTGTVDTSVGTGGGTTPVMGGTVPETGGDNTYIGGGATLEDAGGVPELGGVYATDYPGEGVGDLADYPVNTDYTPPTSDPFLASGAAGGANLPEGPEGGPPGILNPATYANTGDPDLLDLAGGDAGGADGVGIIEDDLMNYDEHYNMEGDVVTEADLANNTSLLQKLGLPADFDLKKAAMEAGMNLAVGLPISLIAKGLGAILPDQDPSVTAINEFYETGEGAKYMDPNSPNYIPGMENYNTVSGNPFDPNVGLQEAYQKRLETINKTLGKMTLEEYQNTDLVQRKKDIEEAMAKEKAMLDQLKYGNPEEIASGIGTADDDSGSEMLEEDDLMGYDEHYDMVEPTTGVTGVTKPGTVLGTKAPDGTTMADMTVDVTLDDIDTHFNGTAAADEQREADERRAAEQREAQRVMQEKKAAEERARQQNRGEGGGGHHGGGASHSSGASSGGGYSAPDRGSGYRGHHWAKGGRVRYSEGGIVSLKNAKK